MFLTGVVISNVTIGELLSGRRADVCHLWIGEPPSLADRPYPPHRSYRAWAWEVAVCLDGNGLSRGRSPSLAGICWACSNF